MTIHKEGYTSISLVVLFIFVTNALINYYIPQATWFIWFWYIISLILFTAVLQFFRNPKRNWIISENDIICPADGKIVAIEETDETEYLKDRRIQISIFMSPINVHVNRSPISGIVKYFKHHPGAWSPKSSTENERTTIAVENEKGTIILIRQIAGALARRIVCYVKVGDRLEQTREFGFIKFGSRVDVFLPMGSQINVNLGDVVKGGITKIATLK